MENDCKNLVPYLTSNCYHWRLVPYLTSNCYHWRLRPLHINYLILSIYIKINNDPRRYRPSNAFDFLKNESQSRIESML